MKTRLFFGVIINLLSQTAFGQKSNNSGYVITGEIKGLGNSEANRGKAEYVYLSGIVQNGDIQVDSARIKNGHFVFKGKVDEPCKARLAAKIPGQQYPSTIDFFLENSKIRISGEYDAGVRNFIKNIKVEGSKNNDDYRELYDQAMVRSGRERILKEYREAAAKKDNVRMRELTKENADSVAAYMAYINEWIAKHPNSLVTLDYKSITLPETEAGLKKFEDELNSMDVSVKTSYKAKTIFAALEEQRRRIKIGTGAQAIEFSQPDVDGKLVKLSDYRGKYVLVDFWASWCHACRDENPYVLKAYDNFHDKGLEVLSVSLDDNKGKWLKAVSQDKLPWTQVSDLQGWDNSAGKAYLLKSIPANFLIDPDGKIIASGLRKEQLEVQLQKVFKN